MPTKKEERLVHLVTVGQYDDYRVLCAAPTRKEAILIAKKSVGSYSWDTPRVESVPLYTGDLEPTWVYRASCEMKENGRVEKREFAATAEWPWELQYVHPRGGEKVPAAWMWVRNSLGNRVGYITVAGLSRPQVESTLKRCIEDFSKSETLRKESQLKGTTLRPSVVLMNKQAKRRERLAKKPTAKKTAKKGG